mgnify:FL=1|jgi:hypothetical protein
MVKTLQQYKVTLEKAEDSAIDSDSKKLGQKTKLGGKPDWIQTQGGSDNNESCPSCKKEMSFIAQIDSFENDSDKQEYMFGDVGMIYVFFCFECTESKSVVESY